MQLGSENVGKFFQDALSKVNPKVHILYFVSKLKL